jgi:hypothetical protein
MSDHGLIAYQVMGGDGWRTEGIASYPNRQRRTAQLAIIMGLYRAGIGLRRVEESYYERGQTFRRTLADSAERPESGLYDAPLRREPDGDILFAS